MEIVGLNELCEINIGKTPSRSNIAYWGKGHKWLSIADMKTKKLYETKEEITDFAIEETKIKKVPKNTVVMSFKLSIGKLAITQEEMYTNEAIASFPIIQPERITTDYLYYALKTLKLGELSDRAVMGATLNKAKLNLIKIPVPSIEVQNRIVKVLIKVEEIIEYRDRQIATLSSLIESVFFELFGDPNSNPKHWNLMKLGDLCNKVTDGKHGDCRNDLNSGYFFISAKDIKNGNIDYTDARQILAEDFEEVHRRTDIEVGDLLLVNTGATIGKSAIVSDIERARKTTLQKSVAVIKIKPEFLNSVYLKQLLYFKVELLMNTASGSSQKNLLLSQIKNFDVIVPPLDLQNEFREIVLRIEKEIFKTQQSKEKLLLLYKSLLQYSFNGNMFNEELILKGETFC